MSVASGSACCRRSRKVFREIRMPSASPAGPDGQPCLRLWGYAPRCRPVHEFSSMLPGRFVSAVFWRLRLRWCPGRQARRTGESPSPISSQAAHKRHLHADKTRAWCNGAWLWHVAETSPPNPRCPVSRCPNRVLTLAGASTSSLLRSPVWDRVTCVSAS